MLPFYYSDISILIDDLNKGTKTAASIYADLAAYLAFVDSWNILGFVFLAASILIMHSIVDHFMLHKLNRYYRDIFFLDGLLWMGKRLLSLIFTALFFILMTNLIVDFHANKYIKSTLDEVGDGKYSILLLGTNKHLQDGVSENVYFTNRIDAVVELYENNNVLRIWISGDNSKEGYNEPRDMKLSLMKKGIPGNIIRLDYAGFRTLDSIVRSINLFGVDDILVVSQAFHLQRALFLSWHFNARAIGYEAAGDMTLSMFLRELLAVPKMVLDIMVLNTQPAYGTTGQRQQISLKQRDLVLISFVLIYLSIAVYLSHDALTFGRR